MSKFRLTPPRREMLLTDNSREPFPSERFVDERDPCVALPPRDANVVVARPRAGFTAERRAQLRALGFEQGTMLADMLDLRGFPDRDAYSNSAAVHHRFREQLPHLHRLLADLPGHADAVRVTDLTAQEVAAAHEKLFLPFFVSRSINPYLAAFGDSFLRLLAQSHGGDDDEAWLVRLSARGELIAAALCQVVSMATYLDRLGQRAAREYPGHTGPVEMVWERDTDPQEQVAVAVIIATRADADLPPRLRTYLTPLLWWHTIGWAIDHGATLLSGGVNGSRRPYMPEMGINVSSAKRRLGMTAAALWARDAFYWRPNRAAFFTSGSTVYYPLMEAGGPVFEYLVSSEPTDTLGPILRPSQRFAQRIFVLTRRDAAAVERLCARAGVAASVGVWREF